MNKNYIILILLFIIVLAVTFLYYQSQGLKRRYRAEVLKGLKDIGGSGDQLLTENDIKDLPEPVQKYLAYTGAIGKPKVRNVRIAFTGEMKLDPQKDWLKIDSAQYNFFANPTRLFFIRTRMFGVPLIGLHANKNGKATMLIKLAGLLTVADAGGAVMDRSETVTFFNDMCILAPATLIDKRISWETVDSSIVKAVFDNHGCKISTVLYFNDQGALTDFVSDDRSMTETGKSYQRIRWSTPVRDYQEIDGRKIPAYAEAVWHLAEGDYCYARFKTEEVEYNCKRFK